MSSIRLTNSKAKVDLPTSHYKLHDSSASVDEVGEIVAEINVDLTDIDLLKCPRIDSEFVANIKRCFGKMTYMRKAEFECRDKQLFKLCLKGVKDKHELHKNRVLGLKVLNDIIERVSTKQITAPHVVNMIWSYMSCMHHFQLRLRSGTSGIVQTSRMRSLRKCKEIYSKLIRMLDPSFHRIVLSSILTFYRGGRIWELEFACKDLVLQLLLIDRNVEQAVALILRHCIKVTAENAVEGKHMFRILYDVLRKLKWRSMSPGLITKLLQIYESSISRKPKDTINFVPLRRSLELCLRHTIKNCSNDALLEMIKICLERLHLVTLQNNELFLELGNLTAYAAERYRMKTFLQAISHKTLVSLTILGKRVPMGLVVIIRIWRNLTDRHGNSKDLKTPRIFFKNCNYHLKMHKCRKADKKFFKTYRHMIYDFILSAIKIANEKWQLEIIYQAMALTIVEIPCGYTASTYISLILHVQSYAFQVSKYNLIKSHYLHAIVMAIISLVCYIHKADILYQYINGIMESRADWAPQLNPPLLHKYEYAEHHILWNKPSLFFSDWEVGFGLWKCFRVKKKNKKKADDEENKHHKHNKHNKNNEKKNE